MTSNNEKYIVLNKELLELCLKDLANILRKRIKQKDVQCELIIVGGASIVLNYGFRESTYDIDCTDEHKILMNDIVNSVAEKHNLPSSWINTDFMNSKSYSPKIEQYSSFYKSFGNGALIIRTIKDEYLLAMKVMSGRKYKNDYSDIYGIIKACNNGEQTITIEKLNKAIIDLYGSIDLVDKEAFEFAKRIINNPNDETYLSIKESEEKNASIIKTRLVNDAEQADVDYILSKLEINK